MHSCTIDDRCLDQYCHLSPSAITTKQLKSSTAGRRKRGFVNHLLRRHLNSGLMNQSIHVYVELRDVGSTILTQ